MKKIPKGLYQSLHNHTYFSDGDCSIEQIINVAEGKLHSVGISDHYLTRKCGKHIGNIKFYEECIRKAAKGHDIRVLAGAEIDCSPNNRLFMKSDDLDVEKILCLDYVMFEYVQSKKLGIMQAINSMSLKEFVSFLSNLRKKGLKIPVGLAHPDIGGDFNKDELYQLAEAEVFFDVNTAYLEIYGEVNAFRKNLDFFTRKGGKVSIGTDTHANEKQVLDIENAFYLGIRNKDLAFPLKRK